MNENKLIYTGLASFMAGLTAISAQLRFYLGPIPYTMQNYAVVLSGLLLPPRYALLSQLLYLALIALGLPFASNLTGGISVLLGYTAGYLWGFPLSAYLTSILSRLYLKTRSVKLSSLRPRDVVVLLALTLIAFTPTYILGFIVFSYYALPGTKLYEWALTVTGGISSRFILLLIASILIFLPQDLFMDHLLAIYSARTIARLLEARGVRIE